MYQVPELEGELKHEGSVHAVTSATVGHEELHVAAVDVTAARVDPLAGLESPSLDLESRRPEFLGRI